VGKSLGQFRVVERIGVGGMASVFKAYQPTLDRYVAIKVLPAYHARDPIFVKRFVDGGTLKERLKKALPVQEAVDYTIQAAEGLDCAHRNGIVHRDVKPANMLVRKDGHLLLSDFGIAKILEGTTNLTRVGTGIGTPQYMSPEQGTGQPVDRRSDIYSLGIVLFHCLTGRVPYTADSPLTITLKHLHDPLPVDRLIAENVPNSIVQVVLKMTAKPPQDRYQSMTELIDALTIALPHPFQRGRSSSISLLPIPSVPLPEAPKSQPLADNNGAGVVTITCFRCGAPNPSTRLYCTTCGDDLSNKRASADRYLGPNGRPVLARLTIQNGPMSGRSYRFHQDVTTIGRTNGNDFVIAGRTVSRRHARLWFDNGRWYLEDIQSVNGTFVNNTRIYQPVALNDGDVVSFGDEIVIFNVTLGS
jgi:serine/threonine protein kinase